MANIRIFREKDREYFNWQNQIFSKTFDKLVTVKNIKNTREESSWKFERRLERKNNLNYIYDVYEDYFLN